MIRRLRQPSALKVLRCPSELGHEAAGKEASMSEFRLAGAVAPQESRHLAGSQELPVAPIIVSLHQNSTFWSTNRTTAGSFS